MQEISASGSVPFPPRVAVPPQGQQPSDYQHGTVKGSSCPDLREATAPRARNGSRADSQTRDVIEVVLVTDGMKHGRGGVGDQTDLDAFSQKRQVGRHAT